MKVETRAKWIPRAERWTVDERLVLEIRNKAKKQHKADLWATLEKFRKNLEY